MFAPGTVVELRKLTWPSKVKYAANYTVLGSDKYGMWIGSRAGGQFRLPNGRIWVSDVDAACCLIDGAHWNTWFFSEPRKNLYLDVLHSAKWIGTTLEYIDVDLDVYGLANPEIVDVDELEENSRLNGYPSELIDQAWRSAKEALRIAQAKAEPLATVGWTWLERVSSSES